MTKKEIEAAEERGEVIETPPAQETPPEISVPDSAPGLGEAETVSAADIVAEDSDRPKADNKIRPPESPSAEIEVSGTPNVNPPAADGAKKRGRRKMTDEEKAKAKEIRDAIKAGRKPDFSKLPSGYGSNAAGQAQRPPRDYYLEACNLFFPASFVAEKWLGSHWGIPIVEKTIQGVPQKCLEPTDEQKQYLANMARWLEYEQFPEVSPRWAFAISSIGYAAPKFKTDPTPQRLAMAWEWVRVKLLRREPKQKKPEEKKNT